MERNDGMKNITAGAENLQSPEPGRYVETYLVKDHVSSESNDLAVVYTTKNMHFNNKTQAICLPKKSREKAPKEYTFAVFQKKGSTEEGFLGDSKYRTFDECSSWSWLDLTCCSKVCVKLDHQQQRIFPKDSGAPLISDMDQAGDYFEVNGILSDLKGDKEMNAGVFAYVQHPDNFEFINSTLVWKEELTN